MGSVKDLEILKPAYTNRLGRGNFHFSDRYSVFDWGKMPDEIENKGKALAVQAAFNFEEAIRRGIQTHYIGLVASDGRLTYFPELAERSNGIGTMQIDLSAVYPPVPVISIDGNGNPTVDYDYAFFKTRRGKLTNYLIPLEIIFRNGLPLGSSVFKRIEKARRIPDDTERSQTLQKIYQSLGLTSEPKPGDILPKPVIQCTTKLEASDRPLTENEAYLISGLTEKAFAQVAPLALKVNDFITEQAERTGIGTHWDGKVEMCFIDEDIGLSIVDVFGTFDEDRFGNLISKEFLRKWYNENQPDWVAACEESKQTGPGWQERCSVQPKNIPTELATLVSQMYMAATNRYTRREIFEAPDLDEVMECIETYR